METRPMDYAGSWYPSSEQGCAVQIGKFTLEKNTPAVSAPGSKVTGRSVPDKPVRLGVAPHAGWVFSGALAAGVYAALDGGETTPLVVVLGGHLGPGDPVLAMTEGSWQTPFGPFTIHSGFRSILESLPNVLFETPQNYHKDNSTELQLPFAKHRFPHAQLLPIRVPPSAVALELGRNLGEYLSQVAPEAVVIASTDLTHYGPAYGFHPRGVGERALRWVREVNDPMFIEAVKEGVGREMVDVAQRCHSACSAGAVAALNEVATVRRARFRQLGYATSADAGPRDKENFVGYMGGVFV